MIVRPRSPRGPLACVLGVAMMLAGALPGARAQQSTEQYIPIGRSPGISHKYSWIGMVEEVNARDSLLTVFEAGTRRTVRITDRTRIWLDRSKLKLPNLAGGTADLQPGRRVEVKYESAVVRQVADWIKIEVRSP